MVFESFAVGGFGSFPVTVHFSEGGEGEGGVGSDGPEFTAFVEEVGGAEGGEASGR